MERNWYYAADGVRHGPLTVGELRALIEGGAVRPDDLVWQPEFGPEWRTVEQARPLWEQPRAAFVPQPARPEEPLLGVAGSRPSCVEAAAQAYSKVGDVLFRPFDVRRWFSMGFCAWLATIGTQSGNFNGFGEGSPEVLKQPAGGALDKLASLWEHPGVVALLLTGVVLSLLLALWMCALRSRGDFMFLSRWYHPDAPILQCWSAARASGRALFLWRIKFFFVCVLLMAADGAFAYALVMKPYLEAGKVWSAELVPPAVACVTAAVLLGVASLVVAHIAKAFVVPLMYWHGVTVSKAWQVVFELCNQYPLAVLGYVALVAAGWVAVALAVVLFALCTCCVGAIPLVLPYFNAVFLLPVLLFFRGLPVCFLSQWRERLVPGVAR